MKKTVVLLTAVLILCLALSGCGGKEETGGFTGLCSAGRSSAYTGELTEQFAHVAWDFSREMLKIGEYPGLNVWGIADETGKNTLLFDWEGLRAELDIKFLQGGVFTMQQYFFDCDGDGRGEFIAVESPGSGSGISLNKLHIIEPDGENQELLDYVLPPELPEAVFAALSLEKDGVLRLGREELQLPEGTELVENSGEIMSSFEISDTIQALFPVGVWERTENGEKVQSFPAVIRADIIFEDGCFRAENLRMESCGG